MKNISKYVAEEILTSNFVDSSHYLKLINRFI